MKNSHFNWEKMEDTSGIIRDPSSRTESHAIDVHRTDRKRDSTKTITSYGL